jgi:carboxyl-terminal processing protease
MHKICRFALAVSLSVSSLHLYAIESVTNEDVLPVLVPESQHVTATKRVTAQFTRAHYKKIKIDDALSVQIYERFIQQLDFSRFVFLASDIETFDAYKNRFDTVITQGDLGIAYDIYNLNLERRLQRYEYALNLLASKGDKTPFDYNNNDIYNFDREDAPWPTSTAELDALWHLKVKYDVVNLSLAGKEWSKIQEVLTKRYKYAVKRLKQTSSEDVFQLLMNSFARVVEPHTSYLSPRNAERFQMEMNLSLEGIGAVLKSEDDYTVIISVVAGGPADKSKSLKGKDRIVGVAQGKKEFVDVIGWRLDDVVDLIKGSKGTEVRLQILSSTTDDENVKIVSMIRDTIKLEDRAAKSEIYFETRDDENVEGVSRKKLGIINIPSFYNHLSRDVKKEIAKLTAENVEGIIVDLRGNGGGSLTEATLLTGLFIDKGPVVQIRDGADRVQIEKDTDGVSYYDGPLTVMVDRYSASASEIFSAAIQDYGRGIIIGEHTFGKGTVQQHKGLTRVYDLYENPLGSIQFTIAKFYRIDGGSTQHRGVLPDIAFPTPIDPKDWGESKEENALPWDHIRKAKYAKLGDLASDVNYLTAMYQTRIKTNREFNYLLEDITQYQAEKDDKTISLNIEQRKAKREKNKEKKLKRVNERLVILGQEVITDLDDLPEELSELDPFLDEAAKITFDYVAIGKLAKNK